MRAQVIDSNLGVLLLESRHKLPESGDGLGDHPVHIFSCDQLAILNSHAVVNPLPELHASDLGSSSVLHEIVERNAAVSANPGSGVGKASLDVLADALKSNLSWDLGVEQIGRSNLDFGAEVIVLKKNKPSDDVAG